MKPFYFFIALLSIVSCSKKKEPLQETTNPFYDSAFVYRDANPLKSLPFFYKAKDAFIAEKNNFGTAKSLTNIGIILTDAGDYEGGQEASLNAIRYLNEKDTAHYEFLRSNYNNIAIANYNALNFKKAIQYYDHAIHFTKNERLKSTYLNNKGNSYREIGDLKKAIEIYNSALSKTLPTDKTEYARVLTNISKAKWLENENYNPEKNFLDALKLRVEEKDYSGQIASHKHLAEFYLKTKPEKALQHSQIMYEIASKINTPDDKVKALETLILLETPEKSKQYFQTYHKIVDSLQLARNNAKSQFALVRFETEKKEAENMKLLAENAKNDLNILIQWIIIAIGLILSIIGISWYKKRKKTLEVEKENEVKKTEEKYIKKVHDEVSGNVYRLMKQVQNIDEMHKDQVVDQLQDIYEQTRDISYQTYKKDGEMFYNRIKNLLKNYENDSTKIVSINNSPDLWSKLNNLQQNEVYLILQELLNNMSKHSNANRVLLNFDEENNNITLAYKDNGIGISGNFEPKNGFKNMVSRINLLNGTYTFEENKNAESFAFLFSIPIINK